MYVCSPGSHTPPVALHRAPLEGLAPIFEKGRRISPRQGCLKWQFRFIFPAYSSINRGDDDDSSSSEDSDSDSDGDSEVVDSLLEKESFVGIVHSGYVMASCSLIDATLCRFALTCL